MSVRRAKRGMAALLSVVAVSAMSCGYRPALATRDHAAKIHPVLMRSMIPSGSVAEEVVTGARETLSSESLLSPLPAYPRLEIEVLRIDESTAGVVDNGGSPLGRGSEIGVVGRGVIVDAPGTPAHGDTGDLRAVVRAASQSTAGTDAISYEIAARAAARRLGRKVAARAVGLPAASDEAPEAAQ